VTLKLLLTNPLESGRRLRGRLTWTGGIATAALVLSLFNSYHQYLREVRALSVSVFKAECVDGAVQADLILQNKGTEPETLISAAIVFLHDPPTARAGEVFQGSFAHGSATGGSLQSLSNVVVDRADVVTYALRSGMIPPRRDRGQKGDRVDDSQWYGIRVEYLGTDGAPVARIFQVGQLRFAEGAVKGFSYSDLRIDLPEGKAEVLQTVAAASIQIRVFPSEGEAGPPAIQDSLNE
jgi:hypothetical protein